MGMASSQARLLNLTSRMHQIEYKAAKIEAEKLQMANESRRVYLEYQNALEATKIQYKTLNTDASATFVDASYNDLCFGNAGDRFALLSTDNGKPYISEEVANQYEANKYDPSGFATAMTGYVPSNIPAYNGSGIYTPPANAEVVENNTDFSMKLGDAKKTTITYGNSITLALTSSVDGTNREYTVSNLYGDNSDKDITFQYLNNGRLVICGNGIEITDNKDENDDIILLGDNNSINTRGGDDIVRIGIALGQNSFTGNGHNNTINTGAGNDHVVVGEKGNAISGVESVLYMSSNIKNDTTIQQGSQPHNWTWYQSSDANSTTIGGTDTTESYASQGGSNDCRLFSLINSLGGNTNNGDLSQYVTINKNGSNYSVKFNKYNGENNTATISETEVKNSRNVTGDLTTILIDLAINKLMWENKDDERISRSSATTAFENADYNSVSKYFFGNDKIELKESFDDFQQQYKKYANGSYSNLLVSFKTTNDALGIVSSHAYSVKSVENNCVKLINPWDDADVLTLNIDTFKDYYNYSYVFGVGNTANQLTIRNTDSTAQTGEPEQVYINRASDSSGNDTEWYYFYNLHKQISEAGGYETVPQQMTGNKEYLRNLLVHGFAYLTVLDKKTKEFVDTSVATNTSLQEVDDEKELRKAEAKYEADMRRIDYKDRKFDYDLAALDAERNAVKSEMETLKTVAKDNVDRTFKLFS